MAKTRDPITEIVRVNLRRFREEVGLTTEKVAAFTGISIDSLRRYEAGGVAAPHSVLVKLAPVYGHGIGDFDLENPPKADLTKRPGVATMLLEGVDVDPADQVRLQQLVDEINQKTREKKKRNK